MLAREQVGASQGCCMGTRLGQEAQEGDTADVQQYLGWHVWSYTTRLVFHAECLS
jgi:hypothetical protein